MSLFLIAALAVFIGGVLIVGALYLLYTKRISLDKVASNKGLDGAAMKIEIEKLIKVSSNAPALGLFLVGLVLIVAGLFYANEESKRENDETRRQLVTANAALDTAQKALQFQRVKLDVSGSIAKSDSSAAGDVDVQLRWPPFRPDGSGKLNGLMVQRDGDGRLPVLAFLHPHYNAESLDLNTEARIEGTRVVIPDGKVVLRKLPGNGGAP